jgi:hypothetical protein
VGGSPRDTFGNRKAHPRAGGGPAQGIGLIEQVADRGSPAGDGGAFSFAGLAHWPYDKGAPGYCDFKRAIRLMTTLIVLMSVAITIEAVAILLALWEIRLASKADVLAHPFILAAQPFQHGLSVRPGISVITED